MNVTGRAGLVSGQKVTYTDVSGEVLAHRGEEGPISGLGPVTPKWMRLIKKNHLWMLTGNDLTQGYHGERRI